MARLPQPGGDSGNWGDVLNDYLSQALKANGQLKDNAVTANVLAPNSVTNAALANDSVNASIIADGSVSEVLLSIDVRAKLNAPANIADGSVALGKLTNAVQASLAKADTALQSAPVTKVSNKTGDVMLTKTDVGLDNVDNTSDTNKPVSAAQQAALDLKVDQVSLAAVATSGSYADLANKPTIPTISDATATTKGMLRLTGDLGGTADAPTVTKTYSKSDIGLTNVDNTSDINKPISTATQQALGARISKVTSTDEALVRFDGTSGQVQNSGVLVDDNNNIAIPGNLIVSSDQLYVNPTTKRVGIGTNQPDAKLKVVSSNSDPGLTISASGGRVLQAQVNGDTKFFIDGSGFFRIGSLAAQPAGVIHVDLATAGNLSDSMIGLTVRGRAAQTGDLLQLQDANSNVMFGVDAAGKARMTGAPTASAHLANKQYVDATVSGFVDVPNSQTITGAKTFSGGITVATQLARSGAEIVGMATRTTAVTLTTASPLINFADATAAAFIVTLPATTTPGVTFIIKKIDTGANIVTVAATSIDGNASIVLAKPNDFVTVVSTTGSGTWKVVGGNIGVASADPVSSQVAWTGAVTLTAPFTPGVRKIQLTGNTTLTVPVGISGQSYNIMLDITQDATGSRSLTINGVKWSYGVTPTLSTAASARDIITLWWSGSDWVGFVGAQGVA